MTRFLLALVLIAVAGTAFADAQRAQRYLADAHYYMGKSDWQSALIQLKNAIQQDPDNGRVWFETGEVNQRLGDLEAAEQGYRAAAAHGYDAAETDAALAEVLVKHDKLGLVLDEIAPGNRPARLEARVRGARGYAYLGLKRAEDAERAFEEAIELSDKAPAARAGLAQVYVVQSKIAEAQELLVRATDEDPSLGDAWLLLGYVRMWLGDRAGAKVPFEKAVELMPTSEPARRARASYLADDDPERARDDSASLLGEFPNHAVANFLDAVIKARRGQIREAEIALQNIRAINEYPPALYLLARINYAQEQWGQAEANVNRLLTLKPDNGPGLILRAALLMRRGANEEAIPILEGLIAARPEDATILAMLADAYIATKQPDQANAMLSRLAAIKNDIKTRVRIAEQQNSIGNYAEALATLQAAQALGPLPAEAMSLLVADLIKEGKIDEAWRTASNFHDQTNGSAEAEVLLGVVALRRDGPVAARVYFQKALEINPGLVVAAVDLAGAYRLDGKIAEARAVLDKAYARDHGNVQIMLARADLEQSQNAKTEEVLWLERARNSDPKATAPRFRLVGLYLDLKNGAKAVAVAKELQQLAEDDPNALAALGQAQLANDELQSALTTLQRMAEVSKESPAALVMLARAQAQGGNVDRATQVLRKALEKTPNNLDVQGAIIEFAGRNKQVEAFIAVTRDLLRKDAGDSSLDELLGALYLEDRRPMEAIAAYAQASARKPTRRAAFGMAQAQANAGSLQSAVATLREWLQRDARDVEARILMARFLAGGHQWADAIAEYEKLVTERPLDPLLRNDLAWCYQAKGDPRALPMAQEAERLAPNLPLVQDTLGWIMVQQGDIEGGLKFLKAAASQQTGVTPGMKYRLAVALDRLGRRSEAQQAVEEALAGGSAFAEAKEAQLLRAKLTK